MITMTKLRSRSHESHNHLTIIYDLGESHVNFMWISWTSLPAFQGLRTHVITSSFRNFLPRALPMLLRCSCLCSCKFPCCSWIQRIQLDPCPPSFRSVQKIHKLAAQLLEFLAQLQQFARQQQFGLSGARRPSSRYGNWKDTCGDVATESRIQLRQLLDRLL